MQRALKGLLKRRSELSTAIEIKNNRWSADDSLQLIKNLQTHRKSYVLHKDTIKTLQSHIQSFQSPLERYQGLVELSKLGPIDNELEACMHAHFGYLEQAITRGYADNLEDSKILQLITQGAAEEAASLVLANNYSTGPRAWNQLIQALILDKQYSLAREIWFAKPRTINAPQWTVRQLFILAAHFRDLEMLAELEPKVGNRPDKLLQTSLLDSMDNTTELLRALRLHRGAQGGGALLAHPDHLVHVLESLGHNEPTGLYNSILQGCFDRYTSLFVFAAYRYLKTTGFNQPDMVTAQILANACHRLGNSKIVSYEVWNHFVDGNNLTPTRKFCETLVRCQFSGIGVRTSLFYLQQMRKRGVYLRNSLHFQLVGSFGDDLTYTQLYSDMRQLEAYSEWDPQLAESESGKYVAQASRNRDAFESSRSIKDIEAMLEFEQQRYK